MELNEEQQQQLGEDVIRVVSTIYDPEIPVNIYELGLIYDIDINDEFHADVKMTLTSPACPVAVVARVVRRIALEFDRQILARQLAGLATVDV